MKKFFASCIAILSAALVMAQPPEVPAEKGASFGEKISADESVPVTMMMRSLKAQGKGKVMATKVQGEVLQVCEKEGCWLKLKNGDETIMVKMRDHAFLVPVAMKGKTIVVKGDAQIKETSVANLRHYAEDAGKSKEEIEKITQPKKEVVINADGIVVI
jgi:hypothetical protein